MNTGRAKQIRKTLGDDMFPVIKAERKVKWLKSNCPQKLPKTKRHPGEDTIDFRERRKLANERKRNRKRQVLN